MPPPGDYLIKGAKHPFAARFKTTADKIEEDDLVAKPFKTAHPLQDKHILPTPAHGAVPDDILKENYLGHRSLICRLLFAGKPFILGRLEISRGIAKGPG
jgi:hypothetical protein